MTRETQKDIDYTLSTFAVEGLKPSKQAVKLYGKMGEKKISLDDAIRTIERNHGVMGNKRV